MGESIWDLFSSEYGPVAGCWERCKEPSDSFKGGEFLEELRHSSALQKECSCEEIRCEESLAVEAIIFCL